MSFGENSVEMYKKSWQERLERKDIGMHAYSALAPSPLSLSGDEPGLRGPAARAVRVSTGARWMMIPTYVGTKQARPGSGHGCLQRSGIE